MADPLSQIVQRMVDAGEPEANIATVIQHFKTQAPAQVSPDEPGTFVGGALRSLGQTAKDTGSAIVKGAASTLNPMTYLREMKLKDVTEQSPDAPTGDYGVGRLKAFGSSLTTPEGGGQAIGQLLMGALLPRAASGVTSAARRGGVNLMQSALKPTATLVKARSGAGFGSKEAIAQAVLDEGRTVSRGGLVKAQDALDATDTAAHTALSSGAGQGVTVDPVAVSDAIGARQTGQFGKQINAQPDTSAINEVRQNFVTNPNVADPTTGELRPIPADLAHEIASNTGANLRGKFGRLGGATVEAEKAGRGAITDQLREKIPELEPIWKREAQQITTRDAIEQALARTGNRDPIGLGGIIGAVKNPALAVTAIADKSAVLKSLLARALHNGPKLDPAAIRALVLSTLSSGQQP